MLHSFSVCGAILGVTKVTVYGKHQVVKHSSEFVKYDSHISGKSSAGELEYPSSFMIRMFMAYSQAGNRFTNRLK